MGMQLMPFEFENKTIRAVIIDNVAWGIAADVCSALDIANNWDAVSRLDDDEKGVVSTDTLGGQQETPLQFAKRCEVSKPSGYFLGE